MPRALLTRLMDFLKVQQITGVFTSLTSGGASFEATDVGVSSVIDTWLLAAGHRAGRRAQPRPVRAQVARACAHSNQIREFLITERGIQLREAYLGPEGVLTGSMRVAQEARERTAERQRDEEMATRRRALERKRRALEAQIAALRTELEAEEASLQRLESTESERQQRSSKEREAMKKSRRVQPREPARRGRNGRPDRSAVRS